MKEFFIQYKPNAEKNIVSPKEKFSKKLPGFLFLLRVCETLMGETPKEKSLERGLVFCYLTSLLFKESEQMEATLEMVGKYEQNKDLSIGHLVYDHAKAEHSIPNYETESNPMGLNLGESEETYWLRKLRPLLQNILLSETHGHHLSGEERGGASYLKNFKPQIFTKDLSLFLRKPIRLHHTLEVFDFKSLHYYFSSLETVLESYPKVAVIMEDSRSLAALNYQPQKRTWRFFKAKDIGQSQRLAKELTTHSLIQLLEKDWGENLKFPQTISTEFYSLEYYLDFALEIEDIEKKLPTNGWNISDESVGHLFRFAIIKSDACALKKILTRYPPNTLINNTCTPIWLAAIRGEKKLLSEFIYHGVNINQQNPYTHLDSAKNLAGQTPLHAAVIYDDVFLVQELLKNGALCDISDCNGFTPLFHAVRNNNTSIISLLIRYGANVNAKNDRYGLTPLFLAAHHNSKHAADLLLENKAEIFERSNNGFFCWDIAKKSGHFDLAENLLAYAIRFLSCLEKSAQELELQSGNILSY